MTLRCSLGPLRVLRSNPFCQRRRCFLIVGAINVNSQVLFDAALLRVAIVSGYDNLFQWLLDVGCECNCYSCSAAAQGKSLSAYHLKI